MLKGKLTVKVEKDGVAEEVILTCYADNTVTGEFNILIYLDKYDLMAEELSLRVLDAPEFWGLFELNGVEFESSFPKSLFIKPYESKVTTNLTNRDFIGQVVSTVSYVIQHTRIHSLVGKGRVRKGVVDVYGNKLKVVLKDRQIMGLDVGIDGVFRLEMYEEVDVKESEYTFLQGMFRRPKREDHYGNVISPTPVKTFAVPMLEYLKPEFYCGVGGGLELGFVDKSKDYFNAVSPSKVSKGVNLLAYYPTFDDLCAAHPEKDFTWLLEQNYKVLDDSNFEEVLEEFMSFDGVIAFDTETSSTDITFLSREGSAGQLVGLSLSKEVGTAYYIPIQHKLFDNVCGGDHHYFMERYMAPLLETKRMVCHNSAFEHRVCYIYNIILNCVYDTFVALGCTLRYEFSDFKYSLEDVIERRFGLDQVGLDDIVVCGDYDKSGIGFWDLPKELVEIYATADADMTLREYFAQVEEDLIGQYNAHEVFDIELKFAAAVAYAEFYGFYIDPDSKTALQARVEKERDERQAALKKMVFSFNPDFNPGSSKQLGEVIYDFYGVPVPGKKRSTAANILKGLNRNLESGTPAKIFIESLLEFRKVNTLYSNFTSKVDSYLWEDSYIFPGTFSFGTNTGRSSTSEPNYQSFDDNVKREIVGRPGYTCFNTDQTQIEYRILAAMSGEEGLIEFFENVFRDYHTYQSARVLGKPYALVTEEERSKGKGVNFGLPYGMADISLAKACQCVGTPAELRRQGADIRRRYFIGQDKVLEFFEGARDGGVDIGYTETYFGRRRYYHPEKFDEGSIRRQAGNHVIQGTAADVYKRAVNRLFARIIKEGLFGLVLINGFIHDEVQCEFHDSVNPDFILKMWYEEFISELEGVELRAGIGFGKSWYEAKNVELHPYFTRKYYRENLMGDVPKFSDCDNLEAGARYNRLNEEALLEAVIEGIGETDADYLEPAFVKIIYARVGDYLKEAGVEYDKKLGLTDEILRLYDAEGYDQFQGYLKIFSKYNALDYGSMNILTPLDTGDGEEVSFSSGGDFGELELEAVDVREVYLNSQGYYFDTELGILYCNELGDILRFALGQGYFLTEGMYHVVVYLKGEFKPTKAYVNYKEIGYIREMYNKLGRQYGLGQHIQERAVVC